MRSLVFPFSHDLLSPDGSDTIGAGDVVYKTNTPSCPFTIELTDEHVTHFFSIFSFAASFLSLSPTHTLSPSPCLPDFSVSFPDTFRRRLLKILMDLGIASPGWKMEYSRGWRGL